MQPQTPKEALKQIQKGYWLLVLFPVALLTFSYFYIAFSESDATYSDRSYTLFLVLLGACMLVVPVMFWLSKSRIKNIHKGTPLLNKLTAYRDFILWTYFGFEFCMVFSAVYYLLTANDYIFILSATLLGLFITFRPTKERVANDLELTQKERFEIE
jgi:hypothetical protein